MASIAILRRLLICVTFSFTAPFNLFESRTDHTFSTSPIENRQVLQILTAIHQNLGHHVVSSWPGFTSINTYAVNPGSLATPMAVTTNPLLRIPGKPPVAARSPQYAQPNYRPKDGLTAIAGTPKPKPLTLLMNFGLDGVTNWGVSNSDEDLQDNCPEGMIFDPFAYKCRAAVALCSSSENNTCPAFNPAPKRIYNIPANATEAKIFMSLGLQNATDCEKIKLFDYPFERKVEEHMRNQMAHHLKIEKSQITNVTVPNFVAFLRETKNVRKSAGDGILEKSEWSKDDDWAAVVEASFILHTNPGNTNCTDSIVEILNRLVRRLANSLIQWTVDDIGVFAKEVWEEGGRIRDSNSNNKSWCKNGNTTTYWNNEFILQSNGSTSSYLMIVATNQTFKPGRFYMEFMVRSSGLNSSLNVSQIATVCEMTTVRECRKFHAEGAKMNPDQTVTYQNRSIDFTEYFIDQKTGHILLCGGAWTPSYLGFDMSDGTVYLSWVLSFLSILSLFLTLIIYAVFKELRTLPGWNLINVMVALMIAQLANLLTYVSNQLFCKIIGILMHYAYLLGFFFANVIAFDIYRTFGRSAASSLQILTSKKSFTKRLLINLTYCYTSTILIVLGAIILDVHHIPGWEVAYEDLCWISGDRASFFFFALPVILILIVNAVLVFMTIWHVRKQSREIKGVRPTTGGCQMKSYKKEAVSYIRIGTVFGFTWISGFISGAVRNTSPARTDDLFFEILSYIFICTQASQGIMIFLAFGINAANRQRIKKLFAKVHWKSCRLCERRLCRCGQSTIIITKETGHKCHRKF